MKYDVIIRGGSVFDSEAAVFEKKTLYVKDGYITKGPEDETGADAAQVIDACGRFVVPGLIDEHAHLNLYGTIIGADADTTCIPSGVTSAADGGTTGASGFELFYKSNIIRYETSVYAYLNVSTFGNKSLCMHEENHDPEDFREDLILHLFRKYPDTLRGLKVRMCRATLEDYGSAPLRKAIEISERLKKYGFHAPVIVHYGDLPENVTVEELMSLLRAGDVCAHAYQTKGETIFDSLGHVKKCVRDAQKRGVVIDSCNGRVHWSFENFRRGFEDGFYPDIISSDLVRVSEYVRPGFSLVHAMCVLSAAGMPTEKILQAVTYNPAKCLGILEKAGTLNEGTPADIAIFDIAGTDTEFSDMFGGTCRGSQMFIPLMTIKQGRTAYRQIFF